MFSIFFKFLLECGLFVKYLLCEKHVIFKIGLHIIYISFIRLAGKLASHELLIYEGRKQYSLNGMSITNIF